MRHYTADTGQQVSETWETIVMTTVPWRLHLRLLFVRRVLKPFARGAYCISPRLGWVILRHAKAIRRPWDNWQFHEELRLEDGTYL